MENLNINGKRLILTEINRDDLPVLLEWRNTETFQSNCMSYSKKCTLNELDDEISKAYKNDRYVHFIARNTRNSAIGTSWIYRFNKQNLTGYTTTFVSEKYRKSHYYGAEMFILGCNFLFETLKCRKVYCEVHENNNESMEIFEKLGLPIEARFKNHTSAGENVYVDLLVFAVYKDNFYKNTFVKRMLTP
ncbi:MAG: GNAT family N-acetyltransferase [Candidatus Pacebacteria bacterium]|jgi:RimJ/RimL family protein N-acetyltransferase|nr:GNAT family N-acetyltransferase [Candidatus Paceibacterota bacterium]MBP9780427.1 GNAT family N-acetyltransferase [Candidatus Paceibacterota bacterium]